MRAETIVCEAENQELARMLRMVFDQTVNSSNN